MPGKTTIFTAHEIITMAPEQPVAHAVAVNDGHVLSLGEKDEVIANIEKSPFTSYEVDPIEIDAMELKDMPVWGTVFGGAPHPGE